MAGPAAATAAAAVSEVDRLLVKLSGMVMEMMGVSLVTWTAVTGSQWTAVARLGAIYVAMGAAREAAIKEFEGGGDDTDATMQATRAAWGSVD